MAVMDEFKEERNKILKEGTFQEKLKYFWDYYKWHTIGGIAVVICLIWIAYDVTHQDESILYAALINCSSVYDDSEYVSAVEDCLGVEDGQSITIDSSLNMTDDTTAYTSYEVIAVRLASNEMDVMVADEEFISVYSQEASLYDLTAVMSEEQLERYSDYFYYVDYALIESGYYEETAYEDQVADGKVGHVSPEDMEQPVAVGVYIATTNEEGDYVCTSSDFNSNYYYSTEAIFTILCYSEHTEAALQFLDYICGYASLGE